MKGAHMKTMVNVTLAFGLAALEPVAVLGFQNPGAENRNTFTIDVAVDCRTAVGGPNRGDVFMINGKIFPAGTLPSGPAFNDPARPLNGVPPIGDWLVRGQHSLPFPAEIASLYNSAGGDFVTQYYLFNDGRAFTVQGYALLPRFEVHLVVTGGIGSFRGASGEIQVTILGTNATGCPNSRGTVILVPGSVRGASTN
jgi:hypothetical protein